MGPLARAQQLCIMNGPAAKTNKLESVALNTFANKASKPSKQAKPASKQNKQCKGTLGLLLYVLSLSLSFIAGACVASLWQALYQWPGRF